MIPGANSGQQLQGGTSSATAGDVDSTINFGDKFSGGGESAFSPSLLMVVIAFVLVVFLVVKR